MPKSIDIVNNKTALCIKNIKSLLRPPPTCEDSKWLGEWVEGWLDVVEAFLNVGDDIDFCDDVDQCDAGDGNHCDDGDHCDSGDGDGETFSFSLPLGQLVLMGTLTFILPTKDCRKKRNFDRCFCFFYEEVILKDHDNEHYLQWGAWCLTLDYCDDCDGDYFDNDDVDEENDDGDGDGDEVHLQ